MNRLYHLLLIGTCFLILCLTGDCQHSIAKDKKVVSISKEKKEAPVTYVCKQLPLYPVGEDLWAWLVYKYEYDDLLGCATATTTSLVEHDDYSVSYPVSCGSPECDLRFLPTGKQVAEPYASPPLHKLPASYTARLDLYPPQCPVYCDQLKKRFLQFGKGGTVRFAKVFYLCVSKTGSPAQEQSDMIEFWYGFEVNDIPKTVTPKELPYYHVNSRAKYINAKNSGEGNCRELSLVNHGGLQYIIRFQNQDAGSKHKNLPAKKE